MRLTWLQLAEATKQRALGQVISTSDFLVVVQVVLRTADGRCFWPSRTKFRMLTKELQGPATKSRAQLPAHGGMTNARPAFVRVLDDVFVARAWDRSPRDGYHVFEKLSTVQDILTAISPQNINCCDKAALSRRPFAGVRDKHDRVPAAREIFCLAKT